MPKFIIERDIPSVGSFSDEQLEKISQNSCSILRQLGPDIQWVESYVTPERVYCVYIAENEDIIRKHAEAGGFPVDRISEVKSIIDPTTSGKISG